MNNVATNYCRTLESIDAVRRFWSALAEFTFAGKDAECITQHWDYAVVTHRTVQRLQGLFSLIGQGKSILNQQAEPKMGN